MVIDYDVAVVHRQVRLADTIKRMTMLGGILVRDGMDLTVAFVFACNLHALIG